MKTSEIEILLLRPDEVQVDRDHFVQRGLNLEHAKNIAKDYNPCLFGLGHVSLRDDGCYYVMDGQHRCTAALIAKRGHEPVPFQVWHGLSVEEEASKFIEFQQKRKAVGAIDRFRVGVTAKHPANVEITRILDSFALKIGLGQSDGFIGAVDALLQVYEGRVRGVPAPKKAKQNVVANLPKAHLLSRTLTILTQAWGRDRNAFDGTLIKGVAALLYKHDTKIEGRRLSGLLAKHDAPARAVGKIKALKEAARVSTVAAAVQYLEGVYNRKLSEDKKL